MAYSTRQNSNAAHQVGGFYHSVREWVSIQVQDYKQRREFAWDEAQLRSFPDQLLNDIGLAPYQIHDAVWNGRTTQRG